MQLAPETLALVVRPRGILYWAFKPDFTLFGPFYTEKEADAALVKFIETEGMVDL